MMASSSSSLGGRPSAFWKMRSAPKRSMDSISPLLRPSRSSVAARPRARPLQCASPAQRTEEAQQSTPGCCRLCSPCCKAAPPQRRPSSVHTPAAAAAHCPPSSQPVRAGRGGPGGEGGRTDVRPAVDHLLQEQLLLRALLHALLHRAHRAEAVHVARARLPDAVHARHRLPARAAASAAAAPSPAGRGREPDARGPAQSPRHGWLHARHDCALHLKAASEVPTGTVMSGIPRVPTPARADLKVVWPGLCTKNTGYAHLQVTPTLPSAAQ
jgi:hypothetical protein